MSILVPNSPKLTPKKLPIASLSPKQNILKKEMELNLAESAVLRNQNSQLEIETNTLRKQLKYLKKSIALEANQRVQIPLEEEKKLERKLSALDDDYHAEVTAISNDRKQQRVEKLSQINSKIKDLNETKQSIYSTINQNKQELKELISSARAKINELTNLKKDI